MTMKPRRYSATSSSNPAFASRSLEDLADSREFREFIHGEFAASPAMGRRDFLRILGGTLGLAGISELSGCVRQPRQTIVPFVNQPEQLVPGKALYYATTLEFCGFGRGVLVEAHEGRPTKVEGNPLHPASLGATSVFEQASILDLYNPARSSAVLKQGETNTWTAFLGELQTALRQLPADGAGLHLLTGAVTSPAFAEQWQALLKRYPAAQWHQYEPIHNDCAFEGSNRAFGRPVVTRPHFDKARVVVSFGSDFLFALPGSIRHARDFMAGRNVRDDQTAMNRLYVLESAPTITGACADERRAIGSAGPDGMHGYVAALARALGVPIGTPGWAPGSAAAEWAAGVAKDIKTAGGPSLLLAGAGESPELHALVHAMNAALAGFSGHSAAIVYTAPVEIAPVNHSASLRALVESLSADRVKVLFLLGGDWARTAPADFGLNALIRKAPLSVHLGLYRTETADAATWHIPQAHPLEAWSDARAFDGTASIAQPLIEPLFGGRTIHELLDCLARFPGRRAYDIVRQYWTAPGRLSESGADAWQRVLHDGVVPNTAVHPQAVTIGPVQPLELHLKEPNYELELVFTPDYSLWDGRFAENAWLQELPRPINRLSWENALLVGPDTARQQDLETGEMVRLRSPDGRTLRAPILVQPGMATGVLAVALGHGTRPEPGASWLHPESTARAFEGIGLNTGTNAYPLRTSAHPWRRAVTLEKIGERHALVTTQPHQIVARPDLVRTAPASDLTTIFKDTRKSEPEPPTLYNLTRKETDGIAWAMVIDLTRCIGCNACAMACQSENNIPPVGHEEVGRGREMHWIRVDSYYFGDPERPTIAFQPVPCMHCETAPCELVCPVAATVHDHEGLNLQIYNRCIGTRYCSNNCPYKVRRFNFFNYPKPESKEPLLLAQNPNVTVRTRGVMEKCTYCVQRITAGRISAEVEKRAIRDGEIVPACAQACPSEAIIFGDLNDPQSRVAKLKRTALNYALLGELNTHPRTTYLMRITNPLQP